MRMRLPVLIALAVGVVGLAGAAVGIAAPGAAPDLPYRAYAPNVSSAENTATPQPTIEPAPTPRPPVYDGEVASLYLSSARIYGGAPLEDLDTRLAGGREVFEDPSRPQNIVMYPKWGSGRPNRHAPGEGGMNTVFSAHVNYVGYGNGPFAYLTDAAIGDALYVTLDNGLVFTYTVKSVVIVPLADLDMDGVVFPALDSYTERVTLISCGGTFIPAAVGGEYTSRVILIAERYVP
ncbi:MAG: class F sortase [Chloroflexi bacterium]|nr:class F sortase [Chloroflexota bacterium]